MDKDYEKICFIVSPISGENTEVRRKADRLIKNIIAPVLNLRDMEYVRIDLVNETGKITDKIIKYLNKSCLVISDVSGNNPNVFYEVGYRHGINKPQILLAETYDDIPFDIKDENIIKYDFDVDKIQKVQEKLSKTIENTLSGYSKKKIGRSISELLSISYTELLNLDCEDYYTNPDNIYSFSFTINTIIPSSTDTIELNIGIKQENRLIDFKLLEGKIYIRKNVKEKKKSIYEETKYIEEDIIIPVKEIKDIGIDYEKQIYILTTKYQLNILYGI